MRRPRWSAAVLLGASCAGTAGISAAADIPHDLAVVDGRLPFTIETAESVTVPLRVVNRGGTSWSSDTGFFLAYHWFDAAGRIVEWDGRRSPLPGVVHPGVEVTVEASLEAPAEPGDYLLQWDVVQEGVLWVSEVDPTPVEALEVSVRASHAFTVAAAAPPRWMVAGRPLPVSVLLRNEGPRWWRGDGSFGLSYRWLSRSGDAVSREGRRVPSEGRRARVFEDVAPGETTRVGVELDAPRAGGVYRLQWDMVEEGVCWFSERGGAPAPGARVAVVTDPVTDPRWWAVACLLAAAAAAATVRRGGPEPMLRLIAAGDGFWCVGALVVKQSIVVGQSGQHLTPLGWILTSASACMLAAATWLLPLRWRGWGRWLVVAVATLVLWTDAVYLRFFGDLPAASALVAAGQAGAVEASIRSLVSAADVWLWLDLLPAAVLVLVAGRLRGSRSWRRPWSRPAAAAVMLIAVAVIVLAAPRGLFDQVFRRALLAREIGVLNLHAADGARWLASGWRRGRLDDRQRREVEEWFASRFDARTASGPMASAAEGMNLVMIQVESLQGFVIGLEVNGREVTPLLNRWRREALWFSNLTDQSLAGRSSDSELATQVSLLPSAARAVAFTSAGNDYTGLADVLASRGYHTASAVPYEGTFWNRRVTHPAYGFARSLFDVDFEPGESIGWGLNDRDFLRQMAARMAGWPQPFAAYLLTLSLHHPFEGFPPQHRILDVGRWRGRPVGEYLHTMHFFDRALAAFMEELDRSGVSERTVIAVWGDHDAGFEWRPDVARLMGVPFDSAGWYLSQEVPLFIRVPGEPLARGERPTTAGHVDVAPTLLALLGVDAGPYGYIGRNLLGESAPFPVVGEYGCWRSGELLFVQGEDGTLEAGRCLDTGSLRELPVDRCADGFAAARRSEQISRLVLAHDLQRWLHQRLLGEAGAGE